MFDALHVPIGESIAMEMARVERRSAASIAARRAAAPATFEPFTAQDILDAQAILNHYA